MMTTKKANAKPAMINICAKLSVYCLSSSSRESLFLLAAMVELISSPSFKVVTSASCEAVGCSVGELGVVGDIVGCRDGA